MATLQTERRLTSDWIRRRPQRRSAARRAAAAQSQCVMRITRDGNAFADVTSSDVGTRERAIARLPGGTRSKRLAISLLRDQEALVRNAALEWLLAQADRSCLAAVIPCMRDRWNVVRISALECVAMWGTPRHRRFVKPLLRDASPLVRVYASWALGELGGPSLEPILLRRLAIERDLRARAGLHEVLFKLGGHRRHLQALVRYLASRNHRAACFAAMSLKNCAAGDTGPMVTDALRRAQRTDDRVAVRDTAGRALTAIAERPRPHNMRLHPTPPRRSRAASRRG
jgi:hypothetical protein